MTVYYFLIQTLQHHQCWIVGTHNFVTTLSLSIFQHWKKKFFLNHFDSLMSIDFDLEYQLNALLDCCCLIKSYKYIPEAYLQMCVLGWQDSCTIERLLRLMLRYKILSTLGHTFWDIPLVGINFSKISPFHELPALYFTAL